MQIAVESSEPANPETLEAALAFLKLYHWIPQQFGLQIYGPNADRFADIATKYNQAITVENSGFHIAFTSEEKRQNQRFLESRHKNLFLVGRQGPPKELDHACIPFEGKKINAPWIRSLLDYCRRHQIKPRLLRCDHSLALKQISKLAEWFKMDQVIEGFRGWLTEEAKEDFAELIKIYPETEISTGIGRLGDLLMEEDPKRTLVLGSLTDGLHLPDNHHGIHFAAVLAKTGHTAFFPEDGRP